PVDVRAVVAERQGAEEAVVLRAVTAAVMDSIHALSGQERVDEYAITVKQRMRAEAGRPPAPPEPRSAGGGPPRGIDAPRRRGTGYPVRVTQFSPDAPARAHAFTLSSADDGLAALGAWREYPRVQQPVWPDEAERAKVFDDLRAAPPLVFASEADVLRDRIG